MASGGRGQRTMARDSCRFLVVLEGGLATELPGVERKGGGDGSEVFEGFNEERAGHWGAPRVVPGVCPGCVFEGGY